MSRESGVGGDTRCESRVRVGGEGDGRCEYESGRREVASESKLGETGGASASREVGNGRCECESELGETGGAGRGRECGMGAGETGGASRVGREGGEEVRVESRGDGR